MSEISIIKRHFSDENFVLNKQDRFRDYDVEAIDMDMKRLLYWVIPTSIFYFFIMVGLLMVMFRAL